MGIGIDYVKEGLYDDIPVEDTIMPLQIGKYTIYDSPLKKQMYNEIFAEFIHLMETYSVVESYPGEKEYVIWKEVFELDNIKAFNLDEDVKAMLITATQGNIPDMEEVKQESESE